MATLTRCTAICWWSSSKRVEELPSTIGRFSMSGIRDTLELRCPSVLPQLSQSRRCIMIWWQSRPWSGMWLSICWHWVILYTIRSTHVCQPCGNLIDINNKITSLSQACIERPWIHWHSTSSILPSIPASDLPRMRLTPLSLSPLTPWLSLKLGQKRHWLRPGKSLGHSISTTSYVFESLSHNSGHTWPEARETMAYLASTLAPLSSRIYCISLVMIQRIPHIRRHVALAQVVYFRTLDTSETVCIVLRTPLCPAAHHYPFCS